MKIYTDSGIKQIQGIQKKQPVSPAEKTSGAGKADKVDFSKTLQELQDIGKDFSVDTQRQARLDDVKKQIAEGSYKPDPTKVAESLLKYIVEGK